MTIMIIVEIFQQQQTTLINRVIRIYRLMQHAGVMGRSWSNKLPQIDNAMSKNQNVNCRQLWTKSQFDVHQYRRTLTRTNSNNNNNSKRN